MIAKAANSFFLSSNPSAKQSMHDQSKTEAHPASDVAQLDPKFVYRKDTDGSSCGLYTIALLLSVYKKDNSSIVPYPSKVIA